jgi:hypothetical protein
MPLLEPFEKKLKVIEAAALAHMMLGFCCTDKEAWYQLEVRDLTQRLGMLAGFVAIAIEDKINAGEPVTLVEACTAFSQAEAKWSEIAKTPPSGRGATTDMRVKVADFLAEHWLYGHEFGPYLGEAARRI